MPVPMMTDHHDGVKLMAMSAGWSIAVEKQQRDPPHDAQAQSLDTGGEQRVLRP